MTRIAQVGFGAASRSVRSRGVSALELLIGLVILGLVAALTIPQFSQASSETREQMLRRTLATLRTAIELYHADYGRYPGGDSSSGDASAARALVMRQLEHRGGRTVYLRDGFPASPVGSGGGVEIIRGESLPAFREQSRADWVYNCDTGYIVANSDAVGSDGLRFDRY